MSDSKLKWYIADKHYISQLQLIDAAVKDPDYGEHFRPYVGIVIKINGFNYYIPVSSPKPKYKTPKYTRNPDFIIIYDTFNGLPKDKHSNILCVFSIGNMIPLPSDVITEVNLDSPEEFEKISGFSGIERDQYISLLQKEIKLLKKREDDLVKRANKIYKMKTSGSTSKSVEYYCDFKLLENAVIEHLKHIKI